MTWLTIFAIKSNFSLLQILTSLYGIISPVMPGMATADPFDRHPAAADDSFFFNGFNGILGTGRIIPAVMSQQRGYA
jgi:hypothetical protein